MGIRGAGTPPAGGRGGASTKKYSSPIFEICLTNYLLTFVGLFAIVFCGRPFFYVFWRLPASLYNAPSLWRGIFIDSLSALPYPLFMGKIYRITRGLSLGKTLDEIQRYLNDLSGRAGLDPFLEIVRGNNPDLSVVHKFGRSDNITTTIAPLALGEVYQTPTSAQALEILSDDTNDTDGGTGAQTVFIEGLDGNFALQSETVTMNGTTAVALANNYTRVFRMYVATSGTYASSSAGSHAGDITLRGSGGGATWCRIDSADFPLGQSQIGAYTIPAGKTGYVFINAFNAEANKSVSLFFFQRPNADDVTTPYSGAMRLIGQRDGVLEEAEGGKKKGAYGPFVGPCDVGFMAKVSTGTAVGSIDFEIYLEDT